MADMVASVVLDLPDLFIGRMYSTVRAVLPDVRRNIRTIGRTLPVGGMLMGVDQRSEVRRLVAQEIPILDEWGCFDRITPSAHGRSSSPSVARSPVLWVPGATAGCWPAPRAGRHPPASRSGTGFMAQVDDRWRQLTPREYTLPPSTDSRRAAGPLHSLRSAARAAP